MNRQYKGDLDIQNRKYVEKSRCYPLWMRFLLPVIGLFALIWFLIRVIPKPSRAAYPCQRIAFPLASSFVLWLAGILVSLRFLGRAGIFFKQQRKYTGIGCLLAGVLIVWATIGLTSGRKAMADDPVPNQPVGTAKGIHPGRVVWVHDPDATDWTQGDGHPWEPEHTSQANVDAMTAKSIRELSGCDTDVRAWDAIFRYFNQQHGKGDVGYRPGEKITIKINLTTCNADHANWIFNPTTYQKINYLDKSDTSPQMIVALLRQLVFKAGVEPNDIAVGDTVCIFPAQWWDICHTEFPEVTYFGRGDKLGRILSVPSDIRQYWSELEYPNSYTEDYIPALYADAEYLINLAVLKGHGAGITLCAKNHYGSYNRRPDAVGDGFYDLHSSLAGTNPDLGQYRALVDIMGHPHMGGKTLLYMIDGLYGGYYWEGTPERLVNTPFNNDWPSSLLVSQDTVAIDCVGMDILWEQWYHGGEYAVRVPGVEDYLVEAAMADDPPSGTFYDPDGDGVPLGSLGVYERWNNSTDRQYSRNLGTGDGIELVYVKMEYKPGDINSDTVVDVMDLIQLAEMWLWAGQPGQIQEDLKADGAVNLADYGILAEAWE